MEEESVDLGNKSPKPTGEGDDLADLLTAEEYLVKKNVVLLEYEKQMFMDMIHSDGLVVCAKGLPYDKVVINIMNAYSDPGNLVLVLNASDWEEEYYKSKIEKKCMREVANTATERERVYLEGGIQFISTRILVVDLLKNRVPIELITGVFVMRAHTIVESCQAAFALRLYRQKNKTGFIKAFSSSAEAFTYGYANIEHTMRSLFVKELYLWPRFHATVRSSLKRFESQTVEIHVPMSARQVTIQGHILDIINYLVKELKRINRSVNLDEITAENCVTKNFHKIIQGQLECIWHQLSSQTKLIVADLKVMRNLMTATIFTDAVSAFMLMKRYRTTDYALNNSGWVLLDSAEHMFMTAKERVFNSEGEFDPELCPKWNMLADIIKNDIPSDIKTKVTAPETPPKVLVLCQDARTCFQLRQFLTEGGSRYLLYTAMQHNIKIGKLAKRFDKVDNYFPDLVPDPKPSSLPKPDLYMEDEVQQLFWNDQLITETTYQERYLLSLTQQEFYSPKVGNSGDNEDTTEDSLVFEPFPEMEDLDVTAVVKKQTLPLICIQAFKTHREGSMALDRILSEMEPHYVILYHCNVAAIRQLEVYEARLGRPINERIKVYFLIHAQTVEEQSYLTSLRREKQAFELIIETKSSMVIPEYQDGKTDEAFVLLKHYKHEDEDANTRKAGGQVEKVLESPKIVVDMREFRSDLPCLIHKRGIEVVPVTISIGDYILTPDICVERKSISDLIGSLNSGRLYNQCVQMQRNYAKSILLIEFDPNKSFHLQGQYMLTSNSSISNADIVKKLQLLTIHFPKLRLIWSPSPYATAKLFEEIKEGKPEPEPKRAAAIGSDEAGGGLDAQEKYNPNIYDFMLRLPGINSKNIHKVMRHGGSLKDMIALTRAELTELLGSEANSSLFREAVYVAHLPYKDEPSTNSKTASKYFDRRLRKKSSALSRQRM